MSDRAHALLAEADRRLGPAAVKAARAAASEGFAGGSAWMAASMGRPRTLSPARARYLGIVKYGLSLLASATMLGATWALFGPLAVLPAALAFYAVEAQLVFLFPVAIEGHAAPFREAFRLTRTAGGTLTVMATVLRIAATMLLGGPWRGGIVRAWSLGCLAIVIWYEQLVPRAGAGGLGSP